MTDQAGFTILDEAGARILDVTDAWSPAAARVLASGEVNGLRLNYAHGFKERSLDFLDAWPIQRLDVLARTITDLEPIYRLNATVERLSVTTSDRASLDLARLPRLGELHAGWSQVRASLSAAPNLRSLSLLDYDEPDLHSLAPLRRLKQLRMKQLRGLRTLAGIEHLPLVQLRPVGARQLLDIEPLASLSRSLEDLSLEGSLSRIQTLQAIGRLPRLIALNIANCGPFESLGPLQNCHALETLYAYESTRVDDGDLSLLLRLPRLSEFRMMNRRHYEPTVDAVREALRKRQQVSGA